MKHSIIGSLAALLFSVASATPTSWDATLKAAGENTAQLKEAWEKCPPEQQKGMEFLVRYMPVRDAAALKADFLLENVNLAYQAREKMPWGKDIPEEIFFNDVLPYATLDESRDNVRADFMKRFSAIAGDAKDATTALKRINDAIEKELGVQYNTKRRAPNQGPTESMQLKMASCTGLSILLCDALRSVCIPCRMAGTAMWTTKEGNHNWNEVWLPELKRWAFTEYNPDKNGLDHGWLVADAARAILGSQYHGVFATSWQDTDKFFPMVWNIKDTSVPGIDVTKRYIELGAASLPKLGECELRIDAVKIGADGKEQRIDRKIEVRQADVLVATDNTPSATADMNEFLTVKVKQGQRYQVLLLETDGRAVAQEIAAPTDKDAHVRVKLVVP